MQSLQIHFGDHYSHFLGDESLSLMEYGVLQERVLLSVSVKKINNLESRTVWDGLYLCFSPKLSKILGFDPNERYQIFKNSLRWMESEKIVAPRLFQTHNLIDYFLVYSDIVHPTRFDKQQVNILDAISVGNVTAKNKAVLIYTPLQSNIIENVTVIITDQVGDDVHFEDGNSVTLVLHIKE